MRIHIRDIPEDWKKHLKRHSRRGYVEVPDQEFNLLLSEARHRLRHLSDDDHIYWALHAALSHVNKRPWIPRWLKWLLIGAALVAAMLLGARLMHAQQPGSQITVITFENSSASTIKVFAAPFRIQCGTNVTCTYTTDSNGNYVMNVTASSTAATSFSALTTGTNTQATMTIGTGASLGVTGSGTNTATGLTGSPAITVSSIIDSGLTTGTSPICPNGTGGAFTTSGCVSGAGTVTDGSGVTTANELAISTTTAHVIAYATTLPTAAVPAFTGDLTNSSGSLATTVAKLENIALPTLASATGYLYDNNGALSLQTPSGGGNVSTSGSPAQYQTAVFASGTTITGVGPGTSGYPFVSGGASANPAYAQLASAGLNITATSCTNQVITAISSGAVGTCTSLSGSYLPNPSASTLGGIESLAAVSHEWINTISTSGVPSATRPADTDISGTTAGATVYVSSGALAELSTTAYSVHASGATNPVWVTPTANGQCFMSAASSYSTTTPSFQTCPSSSISGLTSGYIPQATGSTSIGNSSPVLDNGVTTANTLTYAGSGGISSAGGFTSTASSHGLTVPAGTQVSGVAANVIYGSDTTNGYAEVNENNTGYSRVCTAGNSVCGSGGMTWPSAAGFAIYSGSSSWSASIPQGTMTNGDYCGYATASGISCTSVPVTSVGLSLPAFFTISGSPVTSTGTLTAAYATGLTSNENQVLNVSATGAAELSALTATMIPASLTSTTSVNSTTIPASSTLMTTSTSLALAQTPLTTAGDTLYVNSSPALARLAIGTSGYAYCVSSGLPAWCSTLSGVTGVNGTTIPASATFSATATASNTVTQYDVLVGGASSAIASVAPSSTSGIPLISQGASANPAFGTAVIAGGGTSATSASAALINLFPTAAEVGDMVYCSTYSSGCTAWSKLAGNTSGTGILSESSAGAPSWLAATITQYDLLVGAASNAIASVACGAGTVLQGASSANPSCTATPILGAASTAGTLAMSAGGSTLYTTTLGSAATTSNTVDFFAAVPTANHMFYCAVSSTTCTLTDSGFAYSAVVLGSSPTQYGVVVGQGTQTITTISVGGAGTVLAGAASANPSFTATTTHGVQNTTQGTLTLAGSSSAAGALTLANSGSSGYATTINASQQTASYTLELPPTYATSGSTFLSCTAASPSVCSWAAPSVTLSFPLTVSGTTTSGGIPYFSSTTALSSSGLLAQYAVVVGGGAGAAPVTISAGGAGTLLAGAASANPAFTATPTLGVAGTTAGSLTIAGAASTTPGTLVLDNTGSSPYALTVSPIQLTASYTFEFPPSYPSGSNTALSCTAANPTVCSWTAAGTGTVTDGSGTTTANEVVLSTTTAHVLTYDTILTDNGTTLTYTGTGGASVVQVATTGTGPPTLTGAPGTCGTSASSSGLLCFSSTGNRPVYGYNAGTNYNLMLFSDLPTTQYGILYSGGSNTAPSQIAACGANFPVIGQASAAPVCSTIGYPTSLTSGGFLYASSTTAFASSALITANVLPKSGGAGTAPAASTITDNATDVLFTEPLLGANHTFGSSSGNTAATTSFTSLSLAMPSIPVSTKAHGKCTLVWQGSSTSYTVTLGLNTSAAPTDFWINTAQTITTTTSVANLLPPAAVTTATTTAIMAAATPPATGTSYTTLVDFTLSTSSSSAVIISVYGEVSNTSETLTLEPQSVCEWYP